MKRYLFLFCFLLCLIPVFFSLPVSAAQNGDCGDSATWSLSDSGVLTISGTGAIRDYIYEGANLWPQVYAPWRECDIPVTRVVINPGITRIGDNAFCRLPNLTSVSIPNTVTYIGQAAFCNATSLTSVTVPDSVTYMEQSVFKGCRSLQKATLPATMQTLEGKCFEACGQLTSVNIPGGITEIRPYTFADCISLSRISIPEGITVIDNGAFTYTNLSSVQLPSSLVKLGQHAFSGTKLSRVTIPAGVTQILRDAFGRCYSLKHIEFLGNAPALDGYCFESITATAYYPQNNSTWTEEVRKNYGGTITWAAYCVGGHSWGDWEITAQPTCTQSGLKTQSCSKCEMVREESIAKKPHDSTSVVTPPTCKDDGYTTYTCQVCGHIYTDDRVAAGEHLYGQWTVEKDATCLEEGSRTRSCVACQLPQTEQIPLGEHTYQDTVTPPTCTQEGFTTHTCTLCSHTVKDSTTAPTEHSYGQWTELTPATFRQEGLQSRACADCGQEQREILPKRPFPWAWVIAIAGVALTGGAVAVFVYRKRSRKP